MYVYADGSSYDGEVLGHSQAGGCHPGILTVAANPRTAQWEDSEMNGYGLFKFPNGNHYTGSFRNGFKEGQGTLLYAGTGEKYTGSWFNDKAHGDGELVYAGGDTRYTGQWQDGRKHGKGELHCASAAALRRRWRFPPRFIAGCLAPLPRAQMRAVMCSGAVGSPTTPRGMASCSTRMDPSTAGRWDPLPRRGVCDSVRSPHRPLRVRLQWLDDKRHGHGRYVHTDGSQYEGQWANGRKEGEGVLTLASGDQLRAHWRGGMLSGPGEFAFAQGSPWSDPDL